MGLGCGQTLPCRVHAQKRSSSGTQQLHRQWHHVKKSVPHQWTTTSKGKIRERALGNTSGVDSGITSMKDTCSPASESCASTTEMKGRKKRLPMKTAWNTNANTLQKTMNLNKITHLGRAVLRFCSSAYPRSTCYILKNLAFSHNMSKT